MPICNKPPNAAASIKGAAAEVDDHASEAAKMKRTRAQAYFNSYDFDAIEVLSDDDDVEVGTSRSHRRQQPPLPQFNPTRLPPLTQTVDVNHRSASNLKALSPHSPTSLNGRRCQVFAALTLKDTTNTLASNRSASSTNSSTSQEDHPHKYSKYFQRLGAFFVQGQRVEKSVVHPPPPPSVGCNNISRSTSSQSIPDIVVIHTDTAADQQLAPSQAPAEERVSVVAAVEKVESGNFLLPRAMLKYQSNNGVGVGIGGSSSNSMPLAVSMNTTYATTMKSSGQPNANNNSNNASNTNAVKTLAKDKTTTTTTTTTTATKNMPTLRSSNKTRQIHLNSNEKGTGSSTLARHKKHAPTDSTAPVTARSLDQQQQQQQNVSDCSTELNVFRNGQSSQVSKMAKAANESIATAATLATATAVATTPKTGPTATIKTTTITNSHGKQQRERISSHQSHYSTDKSGSSGYYSSNVCSTYSIEDHIYCEPVIDILDLNSKSKSVLVASKNQNQNNNNSSSNNTSKSNIKSATIKTTTTLGHRSNVGQSENSRGRLKNMNGVGQSERVEDCDDDEGEQHNSAVVCPPAPPAPPLLSSLKLNSLLSPELAPPQLSKNLRILESSIENLDRHLKTYPSSQEHITAFVQAHQNGFMPHVGEELKMRSYQHLPTIMESFDSPVSVKVPPVSGATHWQEGEELADDSLLDIDLDSFLLVNERIEKRQRGSSIKGRGKVHKNSGIVNPSFLPNDEDDVEAEALEENNYKCAKYINSCPEDAYRVESDIVAGSASQKSCSIEHFLKRYEDQIHFQKTRELLEDVRDKIRLLSRASSESDVDHVDGVPHNAPPLPQELNSMIKTLKLELETYLARMNQHSELEIRQLCSGLVKNQHIVKMKKAFERRRSIASVSALDSEYDFSAYEALRDGVMVSASGVPFGIRQQITSVRCASDPNFKMKRKSLTEVFPAADFYVENISNSATSKNRAAAPYENVNFDNALVEVSSGPLSANAPQTQLQRNLSFHQPILNHLNAKVGGPSGGLGSGASCSDDMGKNSNSSSGGEAGDKDSIMEWHRKKPSAWELYYGTNRMNQSLLGKRGLIVQNTNQASLSYPSSRPESDFTLDLPRAEQLRIKMEKEKKFRQRCRYITSFLSLVFFLLTVMVVSLVLTRGKRMFGSMI